MVDESATIASNGHKPPATKPNRLFSALKTLKPIRVAAAPPIDAPDNPSYGMQGVTSDTDIWFDYRVDEVKKEALQLAGEWAQAAIPKVDVVYEEIPPEIILAKRCSEVLRRWR